MSQPQQADIGLGTTYERLSLNRLLSGLMKEHRYDSVLEGPVDGITGIAGINSIVFARMGAEVTVVLENEEQVELAGRAWEAQGLMSKVEFLSTGTLPEDTRSFDLVWNFNAIPRIEEPTSMVEEMLNLSCKHILVFASNRLNYGFPVHRLHHMTTGEDWYHGDVAHMSTRSLERLVRESGGRVTKKMIVDIPWWPDIDSPIEEVLSTFIPFLKRFLSSSKRLDRFVWPPEELPYFDSEKLSGIPELKRAWIIENGPFGPLKIFFAHHCGVLGERQR